MDIFLNNSQENLLEFLVKYYDLIKDKNIFISGGVASNFSAMYRRMFMIREPKIEQKNNGLYYSYDLTEVFDENLKNEGSIKIFDDLTHRGRFKIMAFNYKDVKYRTSIYNTETICFYENINEKNWIKGKSKD